MAKTKIVQNSFVSGVLNDKASGRTDIGKFYNSVAEANNMLVAITGGLFKRPGFEYIDLTDVLPEHLNNPKEVRLIDFVFNTEQKYLFLIYPNTIDIYEVPERELSGVGLGAPFLSVTGIADLTPSIIAEMSFVQRGDFTIFFHPNMEPKTLARGITAGGDVEFIWGTLSIAAVPLFDINDSTSIMWSDEKGWPAYATFFQGRMYCAGSPTYPLTIWGSKSQDYFDFQIAPTDYETPGAPINDTIDSDKINRITGIFSGRELQVFTTGSEFINSSQLITPLDSSWNIQTRYGSNANVPLDSLDGSTFFIDRYNGVREFIYDYNQDAHISNDLTTLSSQLFNDPFRLVNIKASKSDLGRYTYVLNLDGTVAVLNFNKAEAVIAWSKIESVDGTIIDISTVDNELYILVKQPDNTVILQRIDITEDVTFMDSFSYVYGTEPLSSCGNLTTLCSDTVGGPDGWDYFLDNVWCENCTMFVDPLAPNKKVITGLERFNGLNVSVLLDDIYQGELPVENGQVVVGRPFHIAKIGIKYNSEAVTLPLASPNMQMELSEKRIVKIKLYMYNSSGFYIDGEFISSAFYDNNHFDTASPLVTGVYEHWSLGWDTLTNFTVGSDDPLGFNLLKCETHVDVTE